MDYQDDNYLSTVIESFIMNYDQTNISNTSSKNLVSEINLIQKTLSGIPSSIKSDNLNKYSIAVEKELQSRLTGDRFYLNICKESIQRVNGANYIDNIIPVREQYIFEDATNISSLISYTNSPEGILLSVLPSIVNLANVNEAYIDEDMLRSINQLLFLDTNSYVVEKANIIKDSYNTLYKKWSDNKNKDTYLYDILLSLRETYNTFDNIINELSDNENILDGKILESYCDIACEHSLEYNDNILFEKVINLGYLLEARYQVGGYQDKSWQKNHELEKKTRELEMRSRRNNDAKARNNAPKDRAINNIKSAIEYPIQKILNMNKQKQYERILDASFRNKVWRVIRKVVTTGLLTALVGPVLSLIYLIGSVAINKISDDKAKNSILHELEKELEIINEKIDDAKSAGKRKEKYQLMRIRNQMEGQIRRIRLGIPNNN